MAEITESTCGKESEAWTSNLPKLDIILRLNEIENSLRYLNMKDRWDQEDRREHARLTQEREKLRK